MRTWIGLRTRSSFDCESRRHHDWRDKTEKYGITRRHWSVYQSLLLFFMDSPSLMLLPELVNLIVRRAFSIAISERLDTICMVHNQWWLKAKCYGSRLKEEPTPDGLIILTYYGAHNRGHDKDGVATLTNIDIPYHGGGFMCNDVDDNLCYIPERLLSDDWLRTGSSRIRDEELYRDYLRETICNGLLVFTIALFWFYDWLIMDFVYSRYIADQMVTVFSYADEPRLPFWSVFECTDGLSCFFSTPIQCILNPMWFISRLLQFPKMGPHYQQMYPSLVMHNVTMGERLFLLHVSMADSIIDLLIIPLVTLVSNFINTTGTLLV